MSVFPETWFIPVPVSATKATAFWMNSSLKLESDQLLFELQKIFKRITPISKIDFGIVTKLNSSPFYSEDEWNKYLDDSIFFKTEKFFYPYSPDIGSGRNAIFKDWCWKGVGRNYAATRLDHAHSSGRMSYMDVVIEIFFDRLLYHFDPQISVPLLGGFCYDVYDSPFIIRSADVVRCGQIVAGIRRAEVNSVIDFLGRKLDQKPRGEWFGFVLERLLQLGKYGAYQTSPTKDNICLDGRIIDHRTVDWFCGDKKNNFASLIFFSKNLNPEIDMKDWRVIYKQKIKDFTPVFINISLQFWEIKKAFELLELPTFDWSDYVSLAMKYYDLPEFMFNYEDSSLAEERIEKSFEIFEEASRKNFKIHLYPIGSKCCLISIGPSVVKELEIVLKKMFLTTLMTEKKIRPETMDEILRRVLSLYDLSP